MKVLKKNIIAGIGRAIGFVIVYATIALVLKANGIELTVDKYPQITSEIVTIIAINSAI